MTTDPARDAAEWREWTLVVAVVLAFLVLPTVVVFLPTAQAVIRSLGLTLRDAYLVLPLIPALGLGAIAVWTALRSRDGGGN